jgi:hypothetical protein
MATALHTVDAGAVSLSENGVRLLYDCFCSCNALIIKEMLVEAAGVELSSVLTARKLLIPRTATTGKKASLPDPLYVYCTKILSL